MTAVKWLKWMLIFIAAFHFIAGFGLMFSISFQKFAVASYGAVLPWDVRDIYYIRTVGSFAFVLGTLAAMASRDPLKHNIVIIAFIEFFILRNINRHLYSDELYSGFGVSSSVNHLTSIFFGIQAVVLAVLFWQAHRNERGAV